GAPAEHGLTERIRWAAAVRRRGTDGPCSNHGCRTTPDVERETHSSGFRDWVTTAERPERRRNSECERGEKPVRHSDCLPRQSTRLVARTNSAIHSRQEERSWLASALADASSCSTLTF